jgi:hypothetical protein
MKRTLYASALALLIAVSGVAAAQDLGAIARQQRQHKRPSATKVYTNDDIASSPAAAEQPAASVSSAATGAAAAKAAAAKGEKPKETPDEEKAKAAAALQKKADGLKAEIATLEREYNIADRENKLRVANYYADAGNSLRDPKKWLDEQKATQEELASKKKAIEDAKAKLDDVVEQGRKAGIRVNE